MTNSYDKPLKKTKKSNEFPCYNTEFFYICRAIPNAKVAQLVERQPSKLNVASSNLVFRSKPPF